MKANKPSTFVSFTLALILLLGLNSCTAEMGINPEESSPNAILMLDTNLNLLESGADGETANETTIKRLDVLVYEVKSVSANDTTYSDAPIGRAYAKANLAGVIKIEYPKCDNATAFVIANAEEWDLSNIKKSYTVSQLKELKVIYGSTVSAPFKMYAQTDVFSGRKDDSRLVSLVRNVARVDLTLTCKASDIKGMPEGGILQLTKARVFNMARTSQLGKPIEEYNFGKGEYVDGGEITFTENGNYKTEYKSSNKKEIFDGFTTSIVFYLPEHFVGEVGTHTYMTIEGKYYPNGNIKEKGINVVYTLPIGDNITTEKINGSKSFTPADLKIQRNVQYLMAAKITKIEQISDVVVSVEEWKNNDVSGSIEEKKIKLNVSSIKTSIATNAQSTTFVQFWSNQLSEHVRVLPSGSQGGAPFAVNNIFEKLVDIEVEGQTQRPTNLWFNDTSSKPDQDSKSWGHLALQLKKDAVVKEGEVYTITLAAGSLHRTINIEITSPVTTQKEESN